MNENHPFAKGSIDTVFSLISIMRIIVTSLMPQDNSVIYDFLVAGQPAILSDYYTNMCEDELKLLAKPSLSEIYAENVEQCSTSW
ncbi:MAG: hypothetical protein HKP41_18525 [Desulfobacterales bacterium]|nr:hypothetical protein [Deltaproteobacteria bacterium]NNK96350.1 hypothetical protein [Desulfobacterales bacterium]